MGPDLKHTVFIDLERELEVTRRVLAQLPEEHYAWKPHEKSMSLGRLAMHVATLPDWIRVTLDQDELDAASAPRPPQEMKHREELLRIFDRSVAALRDVVARFDVENLDRPWTMRNGTEVMVTRPRSTVYRVWCLNHLIHHRAQLCVYLRLLNVPVPTVYFNTADDPTWVFEQGLSDLFFVLGLALLVGWRSTQSLPHPGTAPSRRLLSPGFIRLWNYRSIACTS